MVPRLLALLVATLLIAGCAANNASSTGASSSMPLRANPCASGAPPMNKQAPIVCVDDTQRTLAVFPEPIHVHDGKSEDRSKPVPIQWYTKSGTGDVHVQMGPACESVKVKGCSGGGKCEAETTPGKMAPCKYDVWITGGKHDRLDPTIIIDPCCT
jgi:hypothetical protein